MVSLTCSLVLGWLYVPGFQTKKSTWESPPHGDIMGLSKFDLPVAILVGKMVTMSWGRLFSDFSDLSWGPQIGVLQIFRTRGSIYASGWEVWLHYQRWAGCSLLRSVSFTVNRQGMLRTSWKLGAPKPLASQTISLNGGYPQIIHFSRIFPLNHPFRRSPILGNQRIRPPRCRREVLHRCVDLPSGAEMGRQIGQSFYGETLDIKMMVI